MKKCITYTLTKINSAVSDCFVKLAKLKSYFYQINIARDMAIKILIYRFYPSLKTVVMLAKNK